MHEIPTTQRTIYLRGLLQSHGRLSLPLGSGLSFSLLQIFQPLRLRQSGTDEKKSPQSQDKEILHGARKESEDDKEALDVLAESGIEALNKSPRGRIVILGSPGTGKTTVLKHLLYHQAQSALENSDVPLPIFLSLPDLAQMGQDLEAYLAHIVSAMGLDTDYGQTLFHAIQHGNAFICLDSLDEVLPRLRTGIIRQINELAQASGNTWIVGSRFTDYKGGQFQQGQFLEWDLQPLDHERRLKLAAQLLPELQRQMTASTQGMHTPDPYMYVQQLSEQQQTASWGMNPLLFSLGTVVYLRRGSLSGSRAMLYREVIAALLETRGGDPQLYRILTHSALELYQIKGRTFTAADLQAVLINLSGLHESTWDVAEMQYRVLNSGLLDVVVSETYSFRHQTFQEYLVASALAGRFMSQDEQIRETAYQLAWSKHTYSRWNEVERLLVGILVQDYGEPGMQQAQAWLTRLLQQRHSLEGDPGHLSLELAIKALGEVAQLQEWQTAETLALEESVATVWSEEVKHFVERTSERMRDRSYDRYLSITTDIGHLCPAAQIKLIEPLLTGLLEGNRGQFGEILGALHSPFITHYLLEALERYPHTDHQQTIKSIFVYLGEYAPIDFLLNELNELDDQNDQEFAIGSWAAGSSLLQLASYVPAEKIVPILCLPGFVRAQAAERILLRISTTTSRELPLADLLSVLHGEQEEASFYAACILGSVQHPAALDPLLAYLSDVQSAKRDGALHALRHYEKLAPLDPIITLLGDADPDIRRGAMDILAHFSSAVPLDLFVQAVSDPEVYVRMQAIEVLGQLGDQAPLEVLTQAMNDPQMGIAHTAMLVLVGLGFRVPLESLLKFLKKQSFSDAILELLDNKELIRQVPAQLLFDIYEQNWQERSEILNTPLIMSKPLANTFLVDWFSEMQHVEQRFVFIWSLRQKNISSAFITARVDEFRDRYYPPYTRASVILGCWQEQSSVDVLVQALADERWRVSDAATKELCLRADECSQADLLTLLKHRHPWVRTNALLVLADCTNLPAIEPLVAALHDDNYQVRKAAAKAFSRYTEDAPLEELLAATLDGSMEVALAAARTLSKVGQRAPALAVAGVMNWLRNEEPRWPEGQHKEPYNAFVDLSAFAPAELLLQAMYELGEFGELDLDYVANALGRMGDQAPIEQLTIAMQDQNPVIQQAAVFALSLTQERAPVEALIEACNTENSSVQEDALAALSKVSAYRTVPDEIFWQQIVKEHSDSAYMALFEAFMAQGKRIPHEVVIEALKNIRQDQALLVKYLDQFPDFLPTFPEKMITETLAIFYLRHRYENESESDATRIIKHLLPKLSVDSLLETLLHPDDDIRMGGLCLLSEYPGAILQEPILSALHDHYFEVQCEAITCLQKRPEDLPTQAIIACLHDNNEWVCIRAITALGSLGAHAPLLDLLAMLDAPTPKIRSAAIQTLAQPGLREQVPTERFVAALGERYEDERQVVLEALYTKDPHLAIEYVIAALGDSDDELALFAFHFFEQIHPEIIPEIVQEAQSLFQDGKPGRFFRSLSLSSLADTLGDSEQAEPNLITQLSELLDWPYWEVRMKAVRALGRLRRNIPDVTIRRLLDLRHDPQSRTVREAADEALAEILSLETGIEDD